MKFIKTVTPDVSSKYEDYFQGIKPTTDDAILQRWVFAFCSIHTTWESNVRGYNSLKDLNWLGSQEEISSRLKEAKTGLHNNKARAIFDFSEKFCWNPEAYSFKNPEDRNLYASQLIGIGLAKTSFAAELIAYEKNYICLDTHVLQWIFGHSKFNGKMNVETYESIEKKWIQTSKRAKVNPVAARYALWDIKQGHADCRYWSHVLENED